MFSSLLKENIADSVLVKLECSLDTDTVVLTEKVSLKSCCGNQKKSREPPKINNSLFAEIVY